MLTVYSIELSPIAIKAVAKLDKRYQQAFQKTLLKLSINPKAGKPLTGALKGKWKIRFSRYRIIYTWKQSTLLIYIFNVGHRKDVYR